MRWLWIFSWTYLIFVLHSGFAREMQIGGCVPHVLLAGLIPMTIRTPGRVSLCLAAVWGLLSDCLIDGRLGADVIGFVLVAFVIRQWNARSDLTSPTKAGVVTAIAVGVLLLVSISVRSLPGARIADPGSLVTYASGSAIYTGLLVTLVSLAAQIVCPQSIGKIAAGSPTVSNKWRMLTG